MCPDIAVYLQPMYISEYADCRLLTNICWLNQSREKQLIFVVGLETTELY